MRKHYVQILGFEITRSIYYTRFSNRVFQTFQQLSKVAFLFLVCTVKLRFVQYHFYIN